MPIVKSTTETIASTCEIYYGGVNMGHTKGPITVTVNKTTFDVTVNEFGPNVPVNSFSLGTSATVEIPLAQVSTEVMAEIIPEAVTVSGGTANEAIYVADTTGTDMLSLAKELIVAPRDGSPQWKFPAAFVGDEFSVPYQLDEQTVISVTMKAIPDPSNPTASSSVFKFERNAYF